jgi:hypothetical protein
LQEQVDQSLGSERLISILSSAFAGVALLLSGIGIFGLLATRQNECRHAFRSSGALAHRANHQLLN